MNNYWISTTTWGIIPFTYIYTEDKNETTS